MYAVEDDAGEPFLLLHGSEPDFAWERFVAAVELLVDRLGVTSVVAMQAIPMPVPHTRPVTVTAHATRRQLIDSYPVYWGEMRIPGSVPALLELRLGEAGIDALGVAAHVPHYLAQATYPAASMTLLEHLEKLTGLHLPVEGLREAAEANRTEIDEQIAASPENTAVVAALEQQFDNFQAAREDNGLLGEAGQVPSAEELGAEFERFLADQDRRTGRGTELPTRCGRRTQAPGADPVQARLHRAPLNPVILTSTGPTEPLTIRRPASGGSGEDDGPGALHDHPVLAVPGDRLGEHLPLDVAADPAHVLDRRAVVDPGDLLLDDRAGVELGGHVVRRRPDQLHPAVVRRLVGVRAHERRQEAVVDVDQPLREPAAEVGGHDLHVAGQHDQVDVAEQLQRRRLGLGLGLGRRPGCGGTGCPRRARPARGRGGWR